MKKIKVTQLWTYPIKSLPGISLQESPLLSKGLEYDRSWMLVDESMHFISQRHYPKMALIKISIEDFGLKLTYKDMPALIVPWVNTELEQYESVKVSVWKDECQALHINTAIDNWFSEVLGVNCLLVYCPSESKRLVDSDYAFHKEQTRFSDGFPLLLISEESLEDLNQRLNSKGEKTLSMKNFRPNIVVNGCNAYAEDDWKSFTVSEVDFSVVKPCSRCVITTVDPDTGVKAQSAEPLRTLMTYRKKGTQAFFGQNLLFHYEEQKVLKLGDTLSLNK